MNVAAVVAHPDDEVLGCGGTLAKHVEAGDDVIVSILGRPGVSPADALKVLGVPAWFPGSLPDQRFDTVPFVKLVEQVHGGRTSLLSPDIVYTHHPGDLNLDHALTARAVLTAFRPKPGEKPRTILACEVLSSTEYTFPQVFQPNWYETLTAHHVLCKVAALQCYPSEIKQLPHPRSSGGVRDAAYYRGSQCGVRYAEAFQLLRRSC